MSFSFTLPPRSPCVSSSLWQFAFNDVFISHHPLAASCANPAILCQLPDRANPITVISQRTRGQRAAAVFPIYIHNTLTAFSFKLFRSSGDKNKLLNVKSLFYVTIDERNPQTRLFLCSVNVRYYFEQTLNAACEETL